MTQTAKCHSVLIVEDNDDIRDAVQFILKKEGFRAFDVKNGREAILALKKIPGPCLVLLDLMMPKMNGWEFLNAHQAEKDLSNFFIVVTSALDGESVFRHPKLASSVVGYMRKPYDLNRLLEICNEYCTPAPSAVS